MLNGQCIITSTNLPRPICSLSVFCFSSLPCPLLPLFLSQIIYSNPLVMMMVGPVPVMQITGVGEFAGTLHVMTFISHSIIFCNCTTTLHQGLPFFHIFLPNAISCFTSFHLSQRIAH